MSQWHSGDMGQVSFCGLIKGISPNICILCVRVKINKRSFKPFCVWITSGSFSVSVFVFLNDVSVSGDVALGSHEPSELTSGSFSMSVLDFLNDVSLGCF